jgi:hypothetical protein
MTNTPPPGVKALKKLPPGVTLKTTAAAKNSERIHLLDKFTW